MPMKAAVFNNKGGVGKTTISIILTQIALKRGRKVAAVDQDEQANFSTSLRYLRDKPEYKDLFTLETVLNKKVLQHPCDLMIIDCAPGFTPFVDAAIKEADIILIPVTPDSNALLHFQKIRARAGDYKELFQLPLVRVGFDANQPSQTANRKIAERKYTVIADLPSHTQITTNLSSGLARWWNTGLPIAARAPFEKLYTRLEKLYDTLQKLRKHREQLRNFVEIGGYYDDPENAYIKLWGRRPVSKT